MVFSSNPIQLIKELHSKVCLKKFEVVLELNQRNRHNLFYGNCRDQNLPIVENMGEDWMDEQQTKLK